MDWTPVFDFLMGLAPWVEYVLVALGSLTVIGIAVDSLVDDKIDKGFMKTILAIPVVGHFLEACKRFSPFNTKKE